MRDVFNDPRIQKILSATEDDDWKRNLERFEQGDTSLNRKSVGESSIKAIQRMLVFLGYSTSSTGAFSIDGDFGRGTNRGLTQFQFEHGLGNQIKQELLCYDCTWQTAAKLITIIPDTQLSIETLEKMAKTAVALIDNNEVMCGDFNEALLQLDGVTQRRSMTCLQIDEHYGKLVDTAVERIKQEQDVTIYPEWILTIIKQETGGIIRPRYEQHVLTRLHRKNPDADFAELRHRAMSLGLGQIMGGNYKAVGATSARELFTSPVADQVYFVARFLARKAEALSQPNPTEHEFRTIGRYYNGPGYEAHHYHEGIARWFREFRMIRSV